MKEVRNTQSKALKKIKTSPETLNSQNSQV